jgi:hypothetical protein
LTSGTRPELKEGLELCAGTEIFAAEGGEIFFLPGADAADGCTPGRNYRPLSSERSWNYSTLACRSRNGPELER